MRIHLTGIRHASTDTVRREVASGDVISDASAAAIASWWQSPGRVGRHLASLASGAPVDADDVRHDIAQTIAHDAPVGNDLRDLQALATWVDARVECDECSEDDGPCEEHCTVLAQREGASVRTADELALVFLDDARAIDPECVSPYGQDVERRALADMESHGSSWITDPDLSDELRSVVDQVEAYICDGTVQTYWEDGYRIVRITGGPLADA